MVRPQLKETKVARLSLGFRGPLRLSVPGLRLPRVRVQKPTRNPALPGPVRSTEPVRLRPGLTHGLPQTEISSVRSEKTTELFISGRLNSLPQSRNPAAVLPKFPHILPGLPTFGNCRLAGGLARAQTESGAARPLRCGF
ncbi:hypothetical protein SKAU_G00334670 [Synaphobranchus kaupii]|uniref:Uncharacterized protein n=1 Tax=Synaphobranchus kaupii TaxID=118154 RepID=A0A9Q1IIT4_SYNKA|nr:hypothetical protein SKAU_G00334670 [Synaphobranchus kaupii]